MSKKRTDIAQPPRGRGRPRIEITPEQIEKVEEAAALGMWPVRIAEAILGVSRAKFQNWRREGRAAGQGIYYELDRAVIRGEFRCEGSHISVLARAAKDGHVAASQYVLDRRFGWAGRHDREAMEDAATDAGVASPEALESLLRRVAETSPHLLRRVLAEAEREATGAPVQEPEGVE